MFGSWVEESIYVKPAIYRAISSNSYNVETDFKACDAHFSWDIVATNILPVYEILLNNPTVYVEFASFIEEMFYQPIYLGNVVMTGKHNLLSGQGITNDFETIYDAELETGSVIAAYEDPVDYTLLSNGDDMSLLGFKSEALAGKIRDTVVEEATLNGHVMALDKCRVERGVVHYLRRLYYPGCGRVHYNIEGDPYLMGAYPAVLTHNSVINPEYRESRDDGQAIAALLQRLDNLNGTPNAQQYIGSTISRFDFSRYNVHDISELKADPHIDWWDRCYGIQWSVSDSYSWNIIKQLKLDTRIIR